jgi:hypothetical protein
MVGKHSDGTRCAGNKHCDQHCFKIPTVMVNGQCGRPKAPEAKLNSNKQQTHVFVVCFVVCCCCLLLVIGYLCSVFGCLGTPLSASSTGYPIKIFLCQNGPSCWHEQSQALRPTLLQTANCVATRQHDTSNEADQAQGVRGNIKTRQATNSCV